MQSAGKIGATLEQNADFIRKLRFHGVLLKVISLFTAIYKEQPRDRVALPPCDAIYTARTPQINQVGEKHKIVDAGGNMHLWGPWSSHGQARAWPLPTPLRHG